MKVKFLRVQELCKIKFLRAQELRESQVPQSSGAV